MHIAAACITSLLDCQAAAMRLLHPLRSILQELPHQIQRLGNARAELYLDCFPHLTMSALQSMPIVVRHAL